MTTLSVSLIPLPISTNPPSTSFPISSHKFPQFAFNYPLQSSLHLGSSATISILFTPNCLGDEGDISTTVDGLRVPPHWSQPSLALQESEWLRVALHKWLDDEYCPEPTNVDISRVAANSYYQSLLQNTTDLGEILLKMARDLESISFQESFHGPFSSANAAVSLIVQRIEHE